MASPSMVSPSSPNEMVVQCQYHLIPAINDDFDQLREYIKSSVIKDRANSKSTLLCLTSPADAKTVGLVHAAIMSLWFEDEGDDLDLRMIQSTGGTPCYPTAMMYYPNSLSEEDSEESFNDPWIVLELESSFGEVMDALICPSCGCAVCHTFTTSITVAKEFAKITHICIVENDREIDAAKAYSFILMGIAPMYEVSNKDRLPECLKFFVKKYVEYNSERVNASYLEEKKAKAVINRPLNTVLFKEESKAEK